MKSSLRAYAQALYETADRRSKAEVNVLIDRLIEELRAKQQLSRLAEILKEVEIIDDKAEGLIRASLTSARPLSKNILEEMHSAIKKKTGAKEVMFTEEISDDILGGIIVRYNDTVLDLSLQQRLEALSEEIKK